MTALRKITALLLLAGLLAGLGGQALAAEAEGQTALDVMRQINTALPVDPQDNYRTYYEVFVYSFYDSDGDGVGDLPGLLEKLDYINDGDPATDADLGCTGLWLMPVCPSPTYHKYDVTDYCAIDPAYGTLDDFRALADACHARGMYLLVDLVMNHTSSSHPWFTQAAEYLRSLEPGAEPDPEACPYVDYYNFSRDSGSGRYALEGTDWYYEAPFWSEMPDLDLNCQAVRAEFDAIVDFWLAQGADGFRLDGAKEYFSGDPDANVQTLSWFNDMVKSKRPDAYIVAEVWTALSSYAPYYASGIDSCFNFAFADSQGTIANSIKRLHLRQGHRQFPADRGRLRRQLYRRAVLHQPRHGPQRRILPRPAVRKPGENGPGHESAHERKRVSLLRGGTGHEGRGQGREQARAHVLVGRSRPGGNVRRAPGYGGRGHALCRLRRAGRRRKLHPQLRPAGHPPARRLAGPVPRAGGLSRTAVLAGRVRAGKAL